MRNHIVVVGYGTKGRTAVAAMIGDGAKRGEIVVVDTDRAALDRADKRRVWSPCAATPTDADVLRLAGAQHAKAIVVATNRDPTAVLVTLTARELAPKAKIIAVGPGGREPAPAAAVRRELGRGVLGDRGPAARASRPRPRRVVEMMEDLLTPDAGFAIAERDVTTKEVGRLAAASARHRARRGARREAAARGRTGGRRAGARRPAALHPQRGRRAMTDRAWTRLSHCATSRCCPASVPTAPTNCAPTSTPRWPAGPTPCCCGSTAATRC